MTLDASMVRRLRRALLRWFRASARDLPWRRTRDPYAIWVSEVMLQQTQVATVLPYYELWMKRFPTVEALAVADEQEVLQVWAGLGYYARARALLSGAREVAALSGLPRRIEELRSLPGIGPYTAGAIASIAFGLREPVVDGNVTRVLSRVFGLRGDPRSAPLHGELWRLAAALVPPRAPGDFNSALMELGAVVCRPAKPDCLCCPIRKICAAHASGTQEELPELPKAPPSERLAMAAALIRREDRCLLVRRPPGERWGGLWQLPALEVAPTEDARSALRRHLRETLDIEVEPQGVLAVVQHSVTRYRVTLTAYGCGLARGEPCPIGYTAFAWIPIVEMVAAGLPSAHRRIAERIQRDEDKSQIDLDHRPGGHRHRARVA